MKEKYSKELDNNVCRINSKEILKQVCKKCYKEQAREHASQVARNYSRKLEEK